jgi:hypothetical protein
VRHPSLLYHSSSTEELGILHVALDAFLGTESLTRQPLKDLFGHSLHVYVLAHLKTNTFPILNSDKRLEGTGWIYIIYRHPAPPPPASVASALLFGGQSLSSHACVCYHRHAVSSRDILTYTVNLPDLLDSIFCSNVLQYIAHKFESPSEALLMIPYYLD